MDEVEASTAGRQPQTRPRRNWGGAISSTGLLVLCVSFFLPQVKGCGEPIVPAKATVDSGGAFLIQLGLPFLAAAMILPIHALRGLLRTRGSRIFAALFICICCLLAMAGGLGWLAPGLVGGASPTDPAVLHLAMMAAGLSPGGASPTDPAVLHLMMPVGAAWILALVGVFKCGWPRKVPFVMFWSGLASLAYFLFWSEGALYGLWVSVGGSAAVAAGGVMECVQSWARQRCGPGVWGRPP